MRRGGEGQRQDERVGWLGVGGRGGREEGGEREQEGGGHCSGGIIEVFPFWIISSMSVLPCTVMYCH